MATLFISDLHIDASRPRITAQFLDFLAREASGADALYVLGDLFESWVGDEAPDPAQTAAIDGLRRLTLDGVPCFVMRGNRDFLLGDRFSEASGAEMLPDPLVLTLYGRRVLVMHGDALCTDDHAYQRLRATVRNPDWQRRFLSLSVAQRRSLADAARDGSRAHTAALEYSIADVNAESVAAVMTRADTDLLLHGHTHRPGVHTLQLNGRIGARIVLGDWYTQGSVLRWDARGYELCCMPRAPDEHSPGAPVAAGRPE